jgi:hypothetical protein
MARFRYSGTNWEGRSWYSSAAMQRMGQEVEVKYPTRRAVDGTVAGKTHDQISPSSDHRPRPFTGKGIVRAIDIGVGSRAEGDAITEHLRRRKDSRIKYVIFNGRIFSSYNHSNGAAWTWRTYYGSNKHTNHIHVSFNSNGDSNGATWGISSINTPTTPEGGEQVLKRGMQGPAVTKFQTALMAERSGSLPKFGADGDFGGETEAAVKNVQGRYALPQTGVIDGVLAGLLLEYVADRVGSPGVDQTARNMASSAATAANRANSRLDKAKAAI